MTKSEELILASQQEDNDIKSFALQCKALKERRSERFIDDWLPVLEMRYPISENNHKYTIITEKYGIIDYFPKANKTLVRKSNKWIKPGLKWLVTNLI